MSRAQESCRSLGNPSGLENALRRTAQWVPPEEREEASLLTKQNFQKGMAILQAAYPGFIDEKDPHDYPGCVLEISLPGSR